MKKLLIATLMMSPLFAAETQVVFSGTEFDRIDCLRENAGGKFWMKKNIPGKKVEVLRVGTQNYEIYLDGVFASSCRYASVVAAK